MGQGTTTNETRKCVGRVRCVKETVEDDAVLVDLARDVSHRHVLEDALRPPLLVHVRVLGFELEDHLRFLTLASQSLALCMRGCAAGWTRTEYMWLPTA